MRTCEVEGCEEKHSAKGVCSKHYSAKYRSDPTVKERIKEHSAKYRDNPTVKEREKKRKAKHYAENKQRIKERRAKHYADPKNKKKLDEYEAKRKADPARKQYTREYEAKRKADPARKQYMKKYGAKYRAKYNVDPAVKQRMKEYSVKYRSNPENKKRKKEWHAKWHAENYVRTGGAGHQPDAPNYVYIVANDELGAAKVDIGTRGRVAAHTSKGWEVVYLSPLMTKQDALKLERAIIGFQGVGGVVPGRHLTKEEMPDGYTETFDLRELDAVIGIMPILCGESDRIDQEQREAG